MVLRAPGGRWHAHGATRAFFLVVHTFPRSHLPPPPLPDQKNPRPQALIFSIRSLIESAARRVASGASPFAPVPSASLASRRAAGAARALAAKAALDAAGPTASPAALAAMTGCDDAAVSLETKWTGLLAAARDRLGSLYSAAARAAAAHDSAVAAAAGTDDGSAPLAFATPTSDSDGAVALAEADLYDHVFTQVLRGLKKQ